MKKKTSLLQWFAIKLFQNNMNMIVRDIRQAPQIKKVKPYVNVQLRSKSPIYVLSVILLYNLMKLLYSKCNKTYNLWYQLA